MAILQIRPGVLDRLKVMRGIQTDEAMSRLGGVSIRTYARYKAGGACSAEFAANMAVALGIGIGELAVARPDRESETEVAS